MPTQYANDIPFSASHAQQAFKLVELPPELLTLLESNTPPTLTIASSSPRPTTPAYALLSVSTGKTYQMRQKNTSNPIMIIKPSSTGPTEAEDTANFIPQPSVCSISKIEDTIELIVQEEEVEGKDKVLPKANKWHEKFAKSREKK